ncbi:MAG TPA: aldolase/citrate lyase family protein [Rhodocyclaceae bacterium]|nr:aldolase/citrate lyase family protein [Rhodocyclaceae bacterium]
MPTLKPGRMLKDKLINGETVFGTFFQHGLSPSLVDVIPDGALDFVIVSAEHNALDLADFLPIRYALAAKGIAVLARSHSREPDDVSKVCDSFDGVVVPYVEEVEHARRLMAAALYRPLKGVALERVLNAGEWPSDKSRKYAIEQRCADTVFIPMIESLRGVENLDAICSIPGVHAVFVGPNDLTTTMGIPNEYDHPDLIAILDKIIKVADARHVATGCSFVKFEQMLRTVRQGARFICFSNDGGLLREAMDSAFGRLRSGSDRS